MKATTLAQLSAADLQAADLASRSGDCCAVLPYWPIWAAAQFASTDENKGLLGFVHVWRDGDAYQIEATDGHRAFRYRFPACGADGMPSLWRIPDDGVLLYAKPLKKAVPYSKLLTVTQDLRAVFHGGRKEGLTELSSVNLSGFFTVHTAADFGKVGSYPNINQLWPQSFSNEPGKPWAFNARYLREWCAVVEKLSDDQTVTRCEGNGATTPFVFSATYAPRIGQHGEAPRLELLLMPVQIRA